MPEYNVEEFLIKWNEENPEILYPEPVFDD
jgi:hypothetical protein